MTSTAQPASSGRVSVDVLQLLVRPMRRAPKSVRDGWVCRTNKSRIGVKERPTTVALYHVIAPPNYGAITLSTNRCHVQFSPYTLYQCEERAEPDTSLVQQREMAAISVPSQCHNRGISTTSVPYGATTVSY